MLLRTGIQVPETRFAKESELAVGLYPNGRLAMVLLDEDGENSPVAKPTVNLKDAELPENHVFLKGWSENEGIPEALEKAGAVHLTEKKVRTGFVWAQVARLSDHLLKIIAEGELEEVS